MVAAALLTTALAGTAADDRISNLPGWSSAKPEMYSGYVTVDASHGRALFYWLVKSLGNPDTDPVVLWMNGGPGCSSLAGGLMSELGPFYPAPDGQSLMANPYTWANNASVVFLESPAGVGFSYSNTSSDYTTGDARTADDVYAFLVGFYQRHADLASRPLWISGESYGGHYVPTVAAKIADRNADPKYAVIPLAGVMVGNAWTVAALDNTGAVEMWYSHSMVSTAAHDGVLATCNMSATGPLLARYARRGSAAAAAAIRGAGALGFEAKEGGVTWQDKTCDQWQNIAFTQMGATDIYDVYVDVCTSSVAAAQAERMAHWRRHAAAHTHSPSHPHPRELAAGGRQGRSRDYAAARTVGGVVAAGYARPSLTTLGDKVEGGADHGEKGGHHHHHHHHEGLFAGGRRWRRRFGGGPNTASGCAVEYNPCIDNAVATYLNTPAVQAAIHAIPTQWAGCSAVVDYSRADLLSSMLPVWRHLLTVTNPSPLRLLVFSGDVDAIVPTLGTRAWLAALALPITQEWAPWMVGGQVGGWTESYAQGGSRGAGLTFASVRNAGHMVPYTQKERALAMMSRFVSNQFP